MPLPQYTPAEVANLIYRHMKLKPEASEKGLLLAISSPGSTIVLDNKNRERIQSSILSGTTILVAKEFSGSLNIQRASGLTFIFHSEAQIAKIKIRIAHYYYSIDNFDAFGRISPRAYLIKNSGHNTLENYTTVFGTIHQIQEVDKEVQEYELANHPYKTALMYKDKSYFFSTNTFVAGVELEIPVYDYKFNRSNSIDKKFWFGHSDNSQIEGDLEVVTKPVSLRYLKSEKFEQRVKSLWQAVEAPDYISAYRCDDEPDSEEETQGSGIHLHVSWHKSIGLNAYDLRMCFLALVHELGWEKYLLDVGGKSKYAMKYFSPVRYQSFDGRKYDAMRVFSENHIEMRWMGSHPDPAVVAARVRSAIDLFEASVLIWQKNTTNQLINNHLCKTLLPLQMRCKKRSLEQQPTAPAPAQAPALSDLPVLAPPFSL